MQQAQTLFFGISVHAREPRLDAGVVSYAPARLLKGLAPQREALALRLLYHAGHVGEHGVGILLLGQRVGLAPELLVALADGRNEIVLLHVARGQRAVEIVYQGHGRFLFHKKSLFAVRRCRHGVFAYGVVSVSGACGHRGRRLYLLQFTKIEIL